jgi:hypothetical protein
MHPILLLRGVERIIAVLVGALAIYLGHNLFLAVPEQRDSEGKVVFSRGASVYLNRVGPGVFFALFGASVTALAIRESLHYATPGAPPTRKRRGARVEAPPAERPSPYIIYSDLSSASDLHPRIQKEHIEQLYRIVAETIGMKNQTIPDRLRQSLLTLYQEIYAINQLHEDQRVRLKELEMKQQQTPLSNPEALELIRLEQRVSSEFAPSRLEGMR